jgi:hypothetical protein
MVTNRRTDKLTGIKMLIVRLPTSLLEFNEIVIFQKFSKIRQTVV